MKKYIVFIAVTFFALGFLPNLLLIFFSPGISSGGVEKIIFIFSILTLILLAGASVKKKLIWILFSVQSIFVLMAVVETFSGISFYVGT